MIKLLQKYEEFFDETLGTWKIYIIFWIKRGCEANMIATKQVPKVNKEIFKKDVEYLVQLGVLEAANDSHTT